MTIYEYFSCCLQDSRTKDLRARSPFFGITRKISLLGTCHFKIIARNIKAIFRENFSSLRVDAGKIFKKQQLLFADQGPHTVKLYVELSYMSMSMSCFKRDVQFFSLVCFTALRLNALKPLSLNAKHVSVDSTCTSRCQKFAECFVRF